MSESATTPSSAVRSTDPGSIGVSAVPSNKRSFSQWLDAFRWVAAFSVVLAHCANRFFVHITDVAPGQRTYAFYGFSLLAGFAHEGVMIFFVLSGYLVGGGLYKEAKRRRAVDLPMYLLKRVSRLGIVLYPSLLLIAVLNLLGLYIFRGMDTGVYAANTMHLMQPGQFACNAAFMQTALCDPYGGNGALWSLYNEFWYYLIWPVMVLTVLVGSTWKRTFLALAAAGMLFLLTYIQQPGAFSLSLYMVIWLLGVCVAALPRPILRSCVGSAALFLVGLSADRLLIRRSFGDIHPIGLFFVDTVVGILFANLLLTMRDRGSLSAPPGGRWNTWLASFSFSLYCIHIPVLNLYGAALRFYTGIGWSMVPDRLWKWCVPFVGILLSAVFAFGLSRITEVHTDELRHFLLRKFPLLRRAEES